MAHALAVYAVAAVLLVAGSGPALQAVRDASLDEFEALGAFRTLDEFPFLERMHPYLPPLVVDWIIVQREGPSDLPPGLDYRFDSDGRVVIVWPDGCEESEEDYREDSSCEPSPPDCTTDPTLPECGDPCADDANRDPRCVPPECPPGYVLDPDWPDAEPACTPDPACSEPEDGSRPADCPPAPPSPGDRCPDGFREAYDGGCVAVATTLLAHVDDLGGGEPDSRLVTVELRVPYENLSIDLDWRGLASNPGWRVTLWNTETGENVCFARSDNGLDNGDGCNPERSPGGSVSGSGTAYYSDAHEGPIQAQNLTLRVSYDSAPAGGSSLEVRLYGKPEEAPDAKDDTD